MHPESRNAISHREQRGREEESTKKKSTIEDPFLSFRSGGSLRARRTHVSPSGEKMSDGELILGTQQLWKMPSASWHPSIVMTD